MMEDVANHGRTVLFVSHNMGLIQTLCQRGIFLENGANSDDGSIGDAVEAYLRSLEQVGEQDLGQRADRRGRGQVQLQKVEISDGSDNPLSILKSGGPARFVFHVNRVVSGMSCVAILFNQFGQHLMAFESSINGPDDVFDPELGPKFICELDELTLLPGRYRLNVMIRDSGEMQDFVEAAAMFDVETGHLRGRPLNARKRMSVAAPHRWIVPVQL
jgi:lipopolysaccharide transport system ATP-binding protein